jgi:hypothetical protein
MTLQPPDFAPMFRPGVRYRIKYGDDDPGADAVVEVRDAGRLHLPTGRLVACEPLWVASLDPVEASFSVTVPPGRYPVTVSLARFDEPGDPKVPPQRRGTAARLTVRDEPVANWQPAVRPDHDPSAVRAGQLDGFGVSRGTGAFLDASALAALSPLSELGSQGQDPEMDELILEVMEKKVVNLVVDRAADLNVIMFDCGLGAGAYPVWLGRTAAGEPACFVADLELLSQHGSGPVAD